MTFQALHCYATQQRGCDAENYRVA
jgi:hypothetical protein